LHVGRLAAELLQRRVERRADQGGLLAEVLRAPQGRRDAAIDEDRAAIVGDVHRVRLHVAMHQSVGVDLGQSGAQLDAQRHDARGIPGLALDLQLAQRATERHVGGVQDAAVLVALDRHGAQHVRVLDGQPTSHGRRELVGVAAALEEHGRVDLQLAQRPVEVLGRERGGHAAGAVGAHDLPAIKQHLARRQVEQRQ
jgi:hypothetical protein